MDLAAVDQGRYMALESFKKNGDGVVTPVWVTAEAGKLYVWTFVDSWKVKRIRRNGRVRVSICDARGNPKSDWLEARAVINEDPAFEAKIQRLLADKYGLMFRVMARLRKVMGGDGRRIVIEISG